MAGLVFVPEGQNLEDSEQLYSLAFQFLISWYQSGQQWEQLIPVLNLRLAILHHNQMPRYMCVWMCCLTTIHK